jgi:hypothetical protein
MKVVKCKCFVLIADQRDSDPAFKKRKVWIWSEMRPHNLESLKIHQNEMKLVLELQIQYDIGIIVTSTFQSVRYSYLTLTNGLDPEEFWIRNSLMF